VNEATTSSPVSTVDLLVRDAELVVPLRGEEISGGWVAVTDGVVVGIGPPGSEPDAREVLSAQSCLVTPGLINTHHHIFQNMSGLPDVLRTHERISREWQGAAVGSVTVVPAR
jgi:cytosine/adenosine deaminase-related metal-dependent hydrolase